MVNKAWIKTFKNHASLFKVLACHTKTAYAKKKTLKSAGDKELDLLIDVLKLINEGTIPLPKKHQVHLIRSKRLGKLAKLTDSFHEELKNSSRDSKLKFVTFFVSMYPKLLYSLFNLPK